MILFLSDNHFGKRGGRVIADALKADNVSVHFVEDDFTRPLGEEIWAKTSLLALHMIADTCGNPLPCDALCDEVLAYLQAGKPLLLLHGSSAAFWHKDWWRPNVGLRWVRNNDPDGVAASWHPVRPFRVERSKTRHPLAARLEPVDLPTDEIYIELEQVSPIWTLLQVKTEEGTYPQAYLSQTQWGGAVACYLPGHNPDVVALPANMHNVRELIAHLCVRTV